MRFAALWVMIGLLGGCAVSTSYTETETAIRIHYGNGGLVEDTGHAYNRLLSRGKRIVIDGPVVSADAFYAFASPGACYTRNAVFSPHAASYLSLVPDYELTGQLADLLPPSLRDWFKGHHSFHDWVGYARVDYDQLVEIWPEGACPDRV